MKKKIILVLMSFCFSATAVAADFQSFLKVCGYGALAGAGLGLVTLAFENKPSQHYGSVARGASLGLYVGVGFGAYEAFGKSEPTYRHEPDYGSATVIIPKFAKVESGESTSHQLDGAEVQTTILNF